ncbi:MAG: STAS domain-containing protein [Desulfotalea sp.]
MNIQIQHNDQSTTIILTGRFDVSVAQKFKETINELLTQNNTHFVIDLVDVDYMDSGGLGSLVASLRRVREKDGEIKISSPNSKVRKVFELTRTHRIFDIYDNSNIAVQSFQTA